MANRKAYFTTVDDATGRWVLAIVTENESGYNSVKPDSDAGGSFETQDEAQGLADRFNERLHLSPREAALIVASSIRVSDVKRDETEGGGVRRRPRRERRS